MSDLDSSRQIGTSVVNGNVQKLYYSEIIMSISIYLLIPLSRAKIAA